MPSAITRFLNWLFPAKPKPAVPPTDQHGRDIMQGKRDCGPTCVLRALKSAGYPVTREQILGLWRWPGTDTLADDLADNPIAHFRVLSLIGAKWRIVTCGEILSANLPGDRTVVLLHAPNDPYFTQHWVTLGWVTGSLVTVYWGDGTTREYSASEFSRLYSAGAPACAYTVEPR